MTFQMKATEQYFPFESMSEILQPFELTVFSFGAVSFTLFLKANFRNAFQCQLVPSYEWKGFKCKLTVCPVRLRV